MIRILTVNVRYGELEVTGGGTWYYMLTPESGTFDLQVKLPDNLTCEQCIFQVTTFITD